MIVLEGVSKSYDGTRYSVRDVTLTVPAGAMLVLLGGSGCGKTTTLKMINRLIEPTAGRIEVHGKDVRGMCPVELRRGIGYVFQGIGLFPHMTVALLSADLIAVMNAGRLVRLGTPRELLTDPADDYVARLMATPRRQADQLEELANGRNGGRHA